MTAKLFVLEGISPYDPAMQDKLLAYIPYYPSQFNWYAYPPLPLILFTIGYLLYLVFATLGLCGAFFERFFVGLVISLGDVFLSYYAFNVGRVLYGEDSARKIEKAILFNPFIIFVSSFWGMIDNWMTAFLLASIYYMYGGDYDKSALFFSMSILVKQLTLFILPLMLAYVAKQHGRLKPALKYVLDVVLFFLLVSFPFLFYHPQNFIYQVFLFHLGRFLQGVSLPAVLFLFVSAMISAYNLPIGLLYLCSEVITVASLFVMLFFLVYIVSSYMANDSPSKRVFMQSVFISIVIILFLNKVSNPQYFVLLVGTGWLYCYGGRKEQIVRIKSVANTILSISILASCGAINYFSFAFYRRLQPLRGMWIVFVRKDVVVVSPILLVIYILLMITVLKLFWIYLEIFRYEMPSMKVVMPHIDRGIHALISKISKNAQRILLGMESKKMVFLLIAIISVGVVVGLVKYRLNMGRYPSSLGPQTPYEEKGKHVGVIYKWIIGSHSELNEPTGFWANAKLTPSEGYYDSSIKRFERDIKIMLNVGIDLIVFDVLSSGVGLSEQVIETASEYGLSFAMLANITCLLDDPTMPTVHYTPPGSNKSVLYFDMAADTMSMIIYAIEGATNTLFQYSNHLRFGYNNVLIVEGLQRFMLGWRYESKYYMATKLIDMMVEEYGADPYDVFGAISDLTGWSVSSIYDLMDKYYPPNITVISDEKYSIWIDTLRYAWRTEFSQLFRGNISVIALMEDLPLSLIREGDIRRVADEVIPLPSPGRIFSPEGYVAIQEENIRRGVSDVVIAVPNFILDKNRRIIVNTSTLYNQCWELAINRNVSMVLIYGWNLYGTGSVIEPTVEFQNYTLYITRYYAEKFRSMEDKDVKHEWGAKVVALRREER